jgi:hypothetical protein
MFRPWKPCSRLARVALVGGVLALVLGLLRGVGPLPDPFQEDYGRISTGSSWVDAEVIMMGGRLRGASDHACKTTTPWADAWGALSPRP